jgi:putative transposase
MRELLILVIHLFVTFAKLLRPGGIRARAAESLLLKHQLLISNRSRLRFPNLSTLDRLVLVLATLLLSPSRIRNSGALIKPITLLKFHKAMLGRIYRLLFSCAFRRSKPCPKGPSPTLLAAIVC